MGKVIQSKIKVFHICSWYPNKVVINDGNFIHKHIRTIIKLTDSYVLAVYEDPNLKNGFNLISGEADGVISYIIYYSKSINKVSNILKRLYYYYKGYNLLKKNYGTPDLIHAHVMLYAGVFSFIVNLIEKVPYIITEHSTLYNSNNLPKTKKQILRPVSKNSKFILPVSKALQNRLSTLGIVGHFEVIPNVVNTTIFKHIIHKNNKFEFLHISSFSEEKNIPGLMSSIKTLSQLRQDFHFTIAGDGDINYVLELKKKFQIEDKYLTILGKLDESGVATLMQYSDVFVLFSNDENLPCVILESFCSGIPVISTNVGGISEVLFENELGALINKNDENSLVDTFLSIISNTTKYDKNYISEYGKQNFSEEIIGKKIYEIYKKAITT